MPPAPHSLSVTPLWPCISSSFYTECLSPFAFRKTTPAPLLNLPVVLRVMILPGCLDPKTKHPTGLLCPVYEFGSVSLTRLLRFSRPGTKTELALGLSTRSCMHKEIFLSCSFNVVARRDLSQHGPQTGLNVLKGGLGWGQTNVGDGSRLLMCVPR